MKLYEMLMGSPIPEMYHLDFQNGTLIISIHSSVVSRLKDLEIRNEMLDEPGYMGPNNPRWGYQEALIWNKPEGQYQRVLCPYYDQNAKANPVAINRSLQVLFDVLLSVDGGHPAAEQLFFVDVFLVGARQFHGFSLSAKVSQIAAGWLRRQSQRTIAEEATAAMQEALGLVLAHQVPKDQVYAHYSDGSVKMEACPLNCAALSPDFRRGGEDPSYSLEPINVDAPWQQLVLLAGLAGLWAEIRRSIIK